MGDGGSLPYQHEMAKRQKDYEREHVTPYIIENPDRFKLLNVSNDIDLSNLRWTLDTKEEFEFMDAVYQKIS